MFRARAFGRYKACIMSLEDFACEILSPPIVQSSALECGANPPPEVLTPTKPYKRHSRLISSSSVPSSPCVKYISPYKPGTPVPSLQLTSEQRVEADALFEGTVNVLLGVHTGRVGHRAAVRENLLPFSRSSLDRYCRHIRVCLTRANEPANPHSVVGSSGAFHCHLLYFDDTAAVADTGAAPLAASASAAADSTATATPSASSSATNSSGRTPCALVLCAPLAAKVRAVCELRVVSGGSVEAELPPSRALYVNAAEPSPSSYASPLVALASPSRQRSPTSGMHSLSLVNANAGAYAKPDYSCKLEGASPARSYCNGNVNGNGGPLEYDYSPLRALQQSEEGTSEAELKRRTALISPLSPPVNGALSLLGTLLLATRALTISQLAHSHTRILVVVVVEVEVVVLTLALSSALLAFSFANPKL